MQLEALSPFAIWMQQLLSVINMSHQLEKNRKSANMGTPVSSSFRRRFHGGLVLTFITLLLLATIVTLTWNYEGVQRLVNLVPTDGFSSWPNRPNTSPGDVHGTLNKEAKKEDNQSKEESPKNKSAFQLDTIPQPLVVNLTILEGATKRGAGNIRPHLECILCLQQDSVSLRFDFNLLFFSLFGVKF